MSRQKEIIPEVIEESICEHGTPLGEDCPQCDAIDYDTFSEQEI
jgi:hypothetical protein